MTIHEFIFSTGHRQWRARHLTFWSVYCLIAFYSEINLDSLDDLKQWSMYYWNLKIFGVFLPMSVFMVYVFIYILIPQFIQKKKYVTFIITAICTMAFCFAVDMIPGYTINYIFFGHSATASFMHFTWLQINYNHSLHKGLLLAMSATSIKLTKGWYLQQIENTRLAKEEAGNRTRLFKSQIQPRFLFHSLQNLYKQIKNNPDEAPDMVIRLADIFSYILYDCNEEYVLLTTELCAINNLAIAENMNEETKTQIKINIQGNCDNKYIAPLTLFSFLESHIGARTDRKSFELTIHIKDSNLALVIETGQAGPYADIEMDSSKKWKDSLPGNFSNDNLHKHEQGDNLTIDATAALTRISTIKNIPYYSIAEN